MNKDEILTILEQLEKFRLKYEYKNQPSDWAIRVCQAYVAKYGGFENRNEWTDLLKAHLPNLTTEQELEKILDAKRSV